MRIGHGVSPHDAIVTHGDNEEGGRKQLGERERERVVVRDQSSRARGVKNWRNEGADGKSVRTRPTRRPLIDLSSATRTDTRGAQK